MVRRKEGGSVPGRSHKGLAAQVAVFDEASPWTSRRLSRGHVRAFGPPRLSVSTGMSVQQGRAMSSKIVAAENAPKQGNHGRKLRIQNDLRRYDGMPDAEGGGRTAAVKLSVEHRVGRVTAVNGGDRGVHMQGVGHPSACGATRVADSVAARGSTRR